MRICRGSRDPRVYHLASTASYSTVGMALVAGVFAACEILTDLRHSRDDAKVAAAIKDLSQLFYRNQQRRTPLFQAAWSRGGVSALLGILRSSQSISLLADATGCLALLLQDNSRAASELASCDILSTLLPLLYPRSVKRPTSAALTVHSPYPLSCPLSWHREWLPVYETTLAVVRKLTYHSPPLQETFAEKGGIRLIIELSSSPEFISSSSAFSAAARDKLATLTLGKKLICHAAATPRHSQNVVLKAFPALAFSSRDLSSLYPSYIVDLVTEREEWVADSLVASQEVWPCYASFPEGTRPVWTCVSVTCVEDGGHVWCQFCLDRPKPRIDAMATLLREIAPPSDNDQSTAVIPAVGELCLAYFDPCSCQAPSCINVPVWGRGRLLGVEPGARLCLLSIDYGVIATLPLSHVLPLPPQCKGVPPLAIPCKLLGVAPIPVCTVVQENAAGILRNLAFEKTAFRREIIAFGGVEALLKMSLSCDVGVAEQATAALLNMATSDEEKTEMGQRGAVETLLALVLQNPSQSSLLPLSLGALYTLTTHSPHNQQRLLNMQSIEQLSAMLSRDQLGENERGTLSALLEILHASRSRRQASKSELAGGAGVKGQSSWSSRPPPSGSVSTPKRVPMCSGMPSRMRRPHQGGVGRGDGEQQQMDRKCGRGGRSMVYRCLGDQDVCEDGMVTSEEGEGGISGSVVTNQSFVCGSTLPYKEDDVHAFKDVDSVKDITRGLLLRSICAMINSGQLCTIYVGVSPEGRVRGVQISRKERDQLGVAIDCIMHNSFSPAIKHHCYKVLFVPVVSGSYSPWVPPHTYVLQLEIRGGGARRKEVYTIAGGREGEQAEQCFSRCGKSNVKTSPQELRNMLATQESSCHGSEISSLLQNIATLRVTLDKITTSSDV